MSATISASMAGVLSKALVSDDMDVVNSVISVKDRSVINQTVEDLHSDEAILLLDILINMINNPCKSFFEKLQWFRVLLRIHKNAIREDTEALEALKRFQRHAIVRTRNLEGIVRASGNVDTVLAQAEYRQQQQGVIEEMFRVSQHHSIVETIIDDNKCPKIENNTEESDLSTAESCDDN
eukprot:GHVO01034609.1.p1 GENE.GHVO01034609.1~~GHVO01034609.1.p1  ORF type:complete len:180 (+),score=30.21 GHVO01034609.1:33-572(+)